MSGFSAEFLIASIDGSNGFRLSSTGPYDRVGDRVSSAGDLNGDGFDDFIVSGPTADANGRHQSGQAWVVFGTGAGFSAELFVAALDGTNGFKITGEAAHDRAGQSISSAGDINHDGFDDLIVGATQGYGVGPGAAYIVYGHSGAFVANLDLGAIDGSNGVQINGANAGDYAGCAVALAGDVNGDGIDDVLIGAKYAGGGAGAAYVVFGTGAGLSASLDLSALDGTNGFRIDGANGDQAGYDVSSAGDVNGDGIDDLLIGTRQTSGGATGAAYVVFGRATATVGDFSAAFNVAALDGANGFKISGALSDSQTGRAIASLGDVNGDGVDDIAVCQSATFDFQTFQFRPGVVYVLYGTTGGFAADLDLATYCNGVQGFIVSGDANLGAGVSAGDINGDGHADLILLASSVSYVVYGGGSSFVANLDVATLDGVNGFKISGEHYAISMAGDLNNDGFDDLVTGNSNDYVHGNGTGAASIILGRGVSSITFVGAGNDDVVDGDSAGDNLSGGAGKDTLRGLAGDDVLNGDDGNDLLYGGSGRDILHGGDGGDSLFGGDGLDNLDGGSGGDKLYGEAGDDIVVGGAGNDFIDGGADNDTIDGGDGNDSIDGGTGADAMTGGDGNDVFYVDNAGDTTIELANGGSDIVRASLTWILGANIETLQLQGAGDIDGTGTAGANNLQGNAGANTLWGLAGVDTINGNDGNDVIVGGQGNDLLRGGLGADSFAVLQESVLNAVLETDQVYDFSTADGDFIDLSAIDAISGGADDAFTLVSSFTKQAGQMTLTFSGGQTLLKLDINGDGKADYQMKINGDVTHDSGGWLL